MIVTLTQREPFAIHDLQAFREALDACPFALADVTLLLRQYPKCLAAMVATVKKSEGLLVR